jgi:hypothetical protein
MAGGQSPEEVLEALFSHLDHAPPGANFLPGQWHSASGAVTALHAVGLLGNEDRERFSQRLAAYVERFHNSEEAQAFAQLMQRSHRPPAPEEMRLAAENALGEILDLVARGREAMRRSPDHAPDVTIRRDDFMLQHAHGALQVLHRMGLVDDHERDEWSARFQAEGQLEPPGPITQVPVAEARAVPRAQAQVERAAQPPPPTEIRPFPPDFAAVGPARIVQVHSPQTQELQVLFLELYADGTIVHWTHAANRGAEPHRRYPRLSFTDGAETPYFMRGGHGGSYTTDEMRNQSILVPAVPRDAEWVEVGLDEFVWRIALGPERPE